jgi:hypothetical protein
MERTVIAEKYRNFYIKFELAMCFRHGAVNCGSTVMEKSPFGHGNTVLDDEGGKRISPSMHIKCQAGIFMSKKRAGFFDW